MNTITSEAIDVLLIEDNPTDLYLVEQMLKKSLLNINKVISTDRIREAQTVLHKNTVHITLLDLSLPDSFGLATYLDIKLATRKIPVIILTGLNDTELAQEALKQGAQDYLVKGDFDATLLSKSIQYSLNRKLAEDELHSSEEKYKQLFYQNPFPTWIYDPVTLQFLEVNDAAVAAYGYSREAFMKMTLLDIRPPEDVPLLLNHLGDLNEQGQKWRHLKKNGELMLVEVYFYPVSYLGKVASQAQIRDITEEVRLQEQLRKQEKAEKKNTTAAVLKALEKDRAFLGEELHDNINQILATAKLYLEYASSTAEGRGELIAKSLDVVVMAIAEIRKLSRRLIVSDIQEMGLQNSIRDLISTIQSVKAISFSLNAADFEESGLDEELKITIYRIIQEQLNNILKHAQATAVQVHLHRNAEEVGIRVIDDGQGFEPSKLRKGVGITNMKSRASLYDGEVTIQAAPGAGCTLLVNLNLHA